MEKRLIAEKNTMWITNLPAGIRYPRNDPPEVLSESGLSQGGTS